MHGIFKHNWHSQTIPAKAYTDLTHTPLMLIKTLFSTFAFY